MYFKCIGLKIKNFIFWGQGQKKVMVTVTCRIWTEHSFDKRFSDLKSAWSNYSENNNKYFWTCRFSNFNYTLKCTILVKFKKGQGHSAQTIDPTQILMRNLESTWSIYSGTTILKFLASKTHCGTERVKFLIFLKEKFK
jgi:hypothetical protein